jgi:hypothetical protein
MGVARNGESKRNLQTTTEKSSARSLRVSSAGADDETQRRASPGRMSLGCLSIRAGTPRSPANNGIVAANEIFSSHAGF